MSPLSTAGDRYRTRTGVVDVIPHMFCPFAVFQVQHHLASLNCLSGSDAVSLRGIISSPSLVRRLSFLKFPLTPPHQAANFCIYSLCRGATWRLDLITIGLPPAHRTLSSRPRRHVMPIYSHNAFRCPNQPLSPTLQLLGSTAGMSHTITWDLLPTVICWTMKREVVCL